MGVGSWLLVGILSCYAIVAAWLLFERQEKKDHGLVLIVFIAAPLSLCLLLFGVAEHVYEWAFSPNGDE